MFCPRCGSANGDDVIFCRSCGLDLVEVRVAIGPGPETAVAVRARLTDRISERRDRSLRRSGLDGNEDALTLEEKAIELNSRGLISLLIGGGFAFLSWMIYWTPPLDGILWTFPVSFSIFFLSMSIGRFTQAAALRRLVSRSTKLDSLDRPEIGHMKPKRSLYETGGFAQPRSVTDATTRHLNSEDREQS